MIYTLDAIRLFLTRRIRFCTLVRAIKERPIAVCGKGGNYVICRHMARSMGMRP